MADAYKTLYQGQLPSTVGTLYTAPTACVIKCIVLVNTASSAQTFQLFKKGTAATNAWTPVWTIPSLGSMQWDGTESLTSGDTLSGVGQTATTITVTISGDEVT